MLVKCFLNRCSTITAREINEISKDNGCCREDLLTSIIMIIFTTKHGKGSARQTCGLPNTTANHDMNLSNITCCFRMYNSRGT